MRHSARQEMCTIALSRKAIPYVTRSTLGNEGFIFNLIAAGALACGAIAMTIFWTNTMNNGKTFQIAIHNCWESSDTRLGDGNCIRIDGRI